MKNPQQLCYVEHPVGIDSRAQDVISALRLTDQACSIVAVLGISGSGKTTIVKAVHDKIAADFDVSCFIENIHGLCTGPNWEVKLQRDAIYRLTQGKNKLKGSDGFAKLIKLLSGQKVLLILDDVYEFKQLQALSIHLASFHDGSRIIVTTRNKLSLSNLPHTPYNIRLLDTIESFELFTRLLGKGDPFDKNFVDAIVQCAGGIPLVLEVWSRHFIDCERKLWPSMLKTLKEIPPEDTQEKLRISYDSLHPKRTQILFLDIACFFHGMEEDVVVKVLQDDFFPDVEIQIQNLVHKFLVKYGVGYHQKKELLLHDVIRKMGQEVVRQENEAEPGKRTRLMGYRDVVHVLGDCSGTVSVRSIKLDYNDPLKEGATVQLEAFKKMSNLRFIKLEDSKHSKLQWSSSSKDDMSACFSFKHLKYLKWLYFPCKSLDNIDMGNVVVIILFRSKLEKLWEGVKNLKKLKILNVSYSRSLIKTGNFNGLENLEELNLYGCENLEELDSSIGCIHQLTKLVLSDCTNLKSIPDLPLNIEYVYAYGCKLGSEGFTQVTRLRNLQELHMGNCNISQVSSGIGNLVSLRFLDLSQNTFSSLPESFSNLSKLKTLDINNCSELQLLPPLPSQLTYIAARDCGSLDVMPYDSIQKAYIFPSQVFKVSNLPIHISLPMEELPEWCTYRDSGNNVLSFVAPIQFDHSKICGLILCATYQYLFYPTIYNKTKGTSHKLGDAYEEKWVMFCPLNDTTLLVEAGDTVEVEFKFHNDARSFKICGLRLVYEDEVVDSGLLLKDVRKPTLSLFPLSSESEIMTGNSINELNDEDICSVPIQNDEEYTYYDFFPMVS